MKFAKTLVHGVNNLSTKASEFDLARRDLMEGCDKIPNNESSEILIQYMPYMWLKTMNMNHPN